MRSRRARTPVAAALALVLLPACAGAAQAELGLGVTWSDTRVPPRGTRFNYLAETAFGVMRRVGRQTHAVAGLRLRHLSNNDREGPGRNPDIEAIGGYTALAVGF